jgi:beta-RFAP synthase
MVAEPSIEVTVEPTPQTTAVGPHSDRALQTAQKVLAGLARRGADAGPVKVTVVKAPPVHAGLGVGTQLSLAIATGIAALAGRDDLTTEELARLTGRGRRSGIGIHGFKEGGLIVDGGLRSQDDVPIKLLRIPAPPDWSVLLVTPGTSPGLSGASEAEAFRRLIPPAPEDTDRLCGLILLGLLPAVYEADLPRFGVALDSIQEVVGNGFGPVQGGCYSSPESEDIVKALRGLGLHGVGQSSWGPTLYGFTHTAPTEREAMREALLRTFPLDPANVLWTAPSNSGAILSK